MLTEAHVLRRALDEAGIEPPVQHPRVKAPGTTTGPCLRVRLASDGAVAAVEDVTDQDWPGLWTIMEGFHNSFPVVRVDEPLFHLEDDHDFWQRLAQLDEAKERRELAKLLEAVLEKEKPDGLSPKNVALWKRLREAKAEELRLCGESGSGPEAAAIAALGRRFANAAENPEDLLSEVARRAVRQLRDARLGSAHAVRYLVVGSEPSSSTRSKVQLAFDLPHGVTTPRGVYTAGVRRELIRLLPIEPASKTRSSEHPAAACALTGESGPLQNGPFPKVSLPVLNQEFPLFSMFSDAKCNFRYGLTDSAAVPVAREAALRMQDALAYIVRPDWKGKTWKAVASGLFDVQGGRKRERMDLLIVYVEGRPEAAGRVATLFGIGEEEVEDLFEVHSETVCTALRGIHAEAPRSRLNLFVLRKASKGQAQVVIAERPTVETTFRGVERWRAATGNVPPIHLPFAPQRKGAPPELRGPQTPTLSQVVSLLSEEWLRGGVRANKVGGVSLADVLDVFLRHDGKDRPAARHLLDLTTRRAGWGILGFEATVRSGRRQELRRFSPERRTNLCRVAGLLGILLDALERDKETYMKGPAFMVDRLLALADSLHVEYCKSKRGGEIPPQLIGNALVPVAVENPRAAVERLTERMNVYTSWAKQASYKEPPKKLAGWLLGQIGDVCRNLGESELPNTTDEAARAELFLGYMAREERRVSDVSADPDEEENS